MLCLVVVKGSDGETGEKRQTQLMANDHNCGQETKYDQRPPVLSPHMLGSSHPPSLTNSLFQKIATSLALLSQSSNCFKKEKNKTQKTKAKNKTPKKKNKNET